MNLEYIDTPAGDITVKLSGEMDALGCTKIRAKLDHVINTNNSNVILNLNNVNFLDSSGIGAIVFLYKRLKAQQRALTITGVRGQPQEIMKLLRIDSAIPINSEHNTNPSKEITQCAS